MGISNLKVGLQRKFAKWSGERVQLEKEIIKINEAAATLETKYNRVERLQTLLECTREIMVELDPKWDAESVKPSIPNVSVLPYPPGMVTRWAMEFIRDEEGSFSSLDLAKKVVAKNGHDLTDRDLVNQVRVAIDASLRKKLGKYVRYTSQRPTMWALIGHEEESD
jgi:hypothetical protein